MYKRQGEFVAGKDSLYASAVFDAVAQQLIVKVVNYNSKPMKVNLAINSKKKPAATAEKITLANANLNQSNSIEEPLNIRPKQNTITYKGKTIVETFEPYSLTLIKLTVK